MKVPKSPARIRGYDGTGGATEKPLRSRTAGLDQARRYCGAGVRSGSQLACYVAARQLLDGDAKAGSAGPSRDWRGRPMLRRHISDYGKLRDAHPAALHEEHQIARSIMWDQIKGLGIPQEAEALAHEASGKFIETMKPLDGLGARSAALKCKPPVEHR